MSLTSANAAFAQRDAQALLLESACKALLCLSVGVRPDVEAGNEAPKMRIIGRCAGLQHVLARDTLVRLVLNEVGTCALSFDGNAQQGARWVRQADMLRGLAGLRMQ